MHAIKIVSTVFERVQFIDNTYTRRPSVAQSVGAAPGLRCGRSWVRFPGKAWAVVSPVKWGSSFMHEGQQILKSSETCRYLKYAESQQSTVPAINHRLQGYFSLTFLGISSKLETKTAARVTCSRKLETKTAARVTCSRKLETKTASRVTCSRKLETKTAARVTCSRKLETKTAARVTCSRKLETKSRIPAKQTAVSPTQPNPIFFVRKLKAPHNSPSFIDPSGHKMLSVTTQQHEFPSQRQILRLEGVQHDPSPRLDNSSYPMIPSKWTSCREKISPSPQQSPMRGDSVQCRGLVDRTFRGQPTMVKRGEHGAAPECNDGGKRENSEKTRRPAASSGTIPTNGNPGATPPGIESGSLEDKIDFKHVYTEVTFDIGSQFIMHALDDSEPIADWQGNKKRIQFCKGSYWCNWPLGAELLTILVTVPYIYGAALMICTVHTIIHRPTKNVLCVRETTFTLETTYKSVQSVPKREHQLSHRLYAPITELECSIAFDNAHLNGKRQVQLATTRRRESISMPESPVTLTNFRLLQCLKIKFEDEIRASSVSPNHGCSVSEYFILIGPVKQMSSDVDTRPITKGNCVCGRRILKSSKAINIFVKKHLSAKVIKVLWKRWNSEALFDVNNLESYTTVTALRGGSLIQRGSFAVKVGEGGYGIFSPSAGHLKPKPFPAERRLRGGANQPLVPSLPGGASVTRRYSPATLSEATQPLTVQPSFSSSALPTVRQCQARDQPIILLHLLLPSRDKQTDACVLDYGFQPQEPMRAIEVRMEQRRDERAGETGYSRENPPTNRIVRHDSHMRKSGPEEFEIQTGREIRVYLHDDEITAARSLQISDLKCLSGVTVAERLVRSPPTKVIRVQSPAGSLRICACGNRAGRCRWSAGSLGDLPFSPPLNSDPSKSLHSLECLSTSFTVVVLAAKQFSVGTRELVVRSQRDRFSTHSLYGPSHELPWNSPTAAKARTRDVASAAACSMAQVACKGEGGRYTQCSAANLATPRCDRARGDVSVMRITSATPGWRHYRTLLRIPRACRRVLASSTLSPSPPLPKTPKTTPLPPPNHSQGLDLLFPLHTRLTALKPTSENKTKAKDPREGVALIARAGNGKNSECETTTAPAGRRGVGRTAENQQIARFVPRVSISTLFPHHFSTACVEPVVHPHVTGRHTGDEYKTDCATSPPSVRHRFVCQGSNSTNSATVVLETEVDCHPIKSKSGADVTRRNPQSPKPFSRCKKRRSWSVKLRPSPQGTSVAESNSSPAAVNRHTSSATNRIRLERTSQKQIQSSDTHKTQYNRVKRCRERKINIKASERVNVDVFTRNRLPCPQHNQIQSFLSVKVQGLLFVKESREPMRVSMKQHRNERAGKTGDPREKPADQRHRPARFPHAKGGREGLASSSNVACRHNAPD
ncbi:hypothetical protein PR048_000217 [Dryococelus australis]|uniref:SRCR domain-containing protein n=1 Tax=Dryococelus australis TaxID=614101 RepID=A0ABQ9IFA7_9NEOP|nr:hypothetical protein PR048_000217 [Dryococelus australis]